MADSKSDPASDVFLDFEVEGDSIVVSLDGGIHDGVFVPICSFGMDVETVFDYDVIMGVKGIESVGV